MTTATSFFQQVKTVAQRAAEAYAAARVNETIFKDALAQPAGYEIVVRRAAAPDSGDDEPDLIVVNFATLLTDVPQEQWRPALETGMSLLWTAVSQKCLDGLQQVSELTPPLLAAIKAANPPAASAPPAAPPG